MLGSSSLIKSIILEFLVLFLLINVIFAFNLSDNVGLPFVSVTDPQTLSNSYFGFTTFWSAWTTYFSNNQILNAISDGLEFLYKIMSKVSLSNFDINTIRWVPMVNDIKFIASFLVDVLFNLPFILTALLYFIGFLLYVVVLFIQLVLFILKLVSGMFYSPLPNTYGFIQDNATLINTLCCMVC